MYLHCMKYIKGQNRSQITIFPVSLEASIEQDNEVRLIDLFVNSLDIEVMGFKTEFVENGRPAYHPKDLLKLYMYGYLNKIRSSRDLEKETKRNIEVKWLLNNLSPDHNTISNFRRDNPKSIKKVFRATVQIAKNFNLIGGKLVAGDSTKFRAQNSKKNNFNTKKIDRHLKYIDSKLEQYESELSDADEDSKEIIQKEIAKHTERKTNYNDLQNQLDETGETQISTSDPESRQMIVRNNITEVAYNTQTTVDEKNNIPIDYKVTNENDSKAMGNMLQRAKTILRTNDFTALYDKGYHTGSEFKQADDLDVDVLVAIPSLPASSHAPDTNYDVEHFAYNEKEDYYICPEGEILTSTGHWYQCKNYRFKQYRTKSCKTCKVKDLCTKAKHNGKLVTRSEYAKYVKQNKTKVENNKEKYRRRQAIVEHPYGTIKRQWGFNYIITKKYIERAEADVGLMFTAYNFRRLLNIIGFKPLQNYLQEALQIILVYISPLKAKISSLKLSNFLEIIVSYFFNRLSKRLIFV